ncbi:class I SAM-dependent methyltransferase [Streptomyces sp. NPDC048282]|uniref:class I SAM-dependent methyltransferase n=1 Tax=Streptomyces sp. NPDC048282 TaxID=3365528 RepID=UPI003715E5B4
MRHFGLTETRCIDKALRCGTRSRQTRVINPSGRPLMSDMPPCRHPGAGNPWRNPDDLYAGRPPWDTGRPQPAFLAPAGAGAVQGRVLDVGCGTGEHALMAAGLGLDATGVDIASRAIDAAGKKARERGLTARFPFHGARRLAGLGEYFDAVLDCGAVPHLRRQRSIRLRRQSALRRETGRPLRHGVLQRPAAGRPGAPA